MSPGETRRRPLGDSSWLRDRTARHSAGGSEQLLRQGRLRCRNALCGRYQSTSRRRRRGPDEGLPESAQGSNTRPHCRDSVRLLRSRGDRLNHQVPRTPAPPPASTHVGHDVAGLIDSATEPARLEVCNHLGENVSEQLLPLLGTHAPGELGRVADDRAGNPTAMQRGGMVPFASELAPTTAPSPMRVPGSTNTLHASETLLPISIESKSTE